MHFQARISPLPPYWIFWECKLGWLTRRISSKARRAVLRQ